MFKQWSINTTSCSRLLNHAGFVEKQCAHNTAYPVASCNENKVDVSAVQMRVEASRRLKTDS